MSTPEATLKAKIRDYIKSIGGYYFAPVQVGMGVAGLDIYACIKGKFVAIEAKAPGKYSHPLNGCTPRQLFVLNAIHNAGGIAIATDSLEHTKQVLGAL